MAKPDPEVLARLGPGYRFVYRVGVGKLVLAVVVVPVAFVIMFYAVGMSATASVVAPLLWAAGYVLCRWRINDDDRSLFPWLDGLDIFP